MSRHVHLPPPILYTAVPKKTDELRRRPGISRLKKTENGAAAEEADSVSDGEVFAASIAGLMPRPSSDQIPDDLPEERKRSGTSLLSDESLKALLQIQEKKSL